MGNRLYVANIPFAATSESLTRHFAQAGSVTDVQIMLDKVTGRPRGIAFVTMSSDHEAQNAISSLNGQPFEGRPLTVNEARPREDRAGGPPRRSFEAGAPRPSAPPTGGPGERREFGGERRSFSSGPGSGGGGPGGGGGGGSGGGGRKDKHHGRGGRGEREFRRERGRDFEEGRGERRGRRELNDDDDFAGGRNFLRGDFEDEE